MKFSRAFTMIELIFVIVVLGILAAVALPKFGKTREIADIAKGRGDVATIRTAIANKRQSTVILGNPSYPASLDNTGLFDGVLMYPMADSTNSGNWHKTAANKYDFNVGSTPTTFTYYPTDSGSNKAGTFVCTAGSGNCDALVN